MGWTRWRKIAEGDEYLSDWSDYDGPAVYELGTGRPDGGDIQPHYVGETQCECERINAYARHGSHLRCIIEIHLDLGRSLYYRATACGSKNEAKRRQDELLRRFDYDWNIVLNRR